MRGIPLLAVTLISAPERYVPIFAMMAANTEWWREESWNLLEETSLALSLETMFGWAPIPSFCRGGFFLPVLGPGRGKSSRGHESGKGIFLILKRPHAEKRLPACGLWRMVKVASAAPAAAHHQGGQPQQAQGSCSCFRHGKHDAVVKFDVVDIQSAVHGAGISERSPKLGACQGRGGWIPLGNRTCQSAVDIHGKRLGGKIGNDAQISPAVLLEIRPGQSRIDIPASLAAEPLIVEVEFSIISEFQHHAVGFSGDRSIGVQAENVFPPIAGGTQVFQVKAHGETALDTRYV